MERVGLAVVLVALVGTPALAQRVEIAVWGGVYQPMPLTHHAADITDCIRPGPGCGLTLVQTSRSPSAVLGAGVSVAVSPLFALQAIVRRAHGTQKVWAGNGPYISTRSERHWATLVVLQPQLRLRLEDGVELDVGAGPSAAKVGDEVGLGFEVTAALRFRVSPRTWATVGGSNAHITGRDFRGFRNHSIATAGMAFAVGP